MWPGERWNQDMAQFGMPGDRYRPKDLITNHQMESLNSALRTLDLLVGEGARASGAGSPRPSLAAGCSQGLPQSSAASELPACALRAHQQYGRAIAADPSLETDDQVYRWVKEKEVDVPKSPETWKRNLRTARRRYGEQKHRPRHPVLNRSVVGVEQV